LSAKISIISTTPTLLSDRQFSDLNLVALKNNHLGLQKGGKNDVLGMNSLKNLSAGVMLLAGYEQNISPVVWFSLLSGPFGYVRILGPVS